jgi:hypothetical protein
MRWLKQRLRNWLNSDDVETLSMNKLDSTRDRHELDGEPLRFNIFRANGGTVVQTYIYDRQRDRSNTQLHIVRHDQDLGESLNKILTMESLRG